MNRVGELRSGNMTQADDKPGKQMLWQSLTDARLVEIAVEEFPDRIRAVKQAVIMRLSQLMREHTDWRERESAAYSLGTLKKLESKLARAGKHVEEE